MSEHESKSEVAQLMHQIELEYQSAQRGLTGLAQGTASHAFITKRLENIGAYQEHLARLVGTEQAAQMVCNAAEQYL